MTDKYVIDTSSLVKLNRENPIDVYPSVWKKIEELIKQNKLVSPKEVHNEINLNDDHLANWAKSQKNLFVKPTKKQIEIVQKILEDYPSSIDAERKFDADPWVIALAKELIENPQKTISEIKVIVVTEEKIRGNKVKIPLICKNLAIPSIDLISAFREEDWKF